MGSFNLQAAVTAINHQAEQRAAGNVELSSVPMNSSIFVYELGASSVSTALRAKQGVLETSVQGHYNHGTVKRMIGGGFLNSLKSAIGWASSKLPHARNALGKIDHPYAKIGHDVLKTMGYGKPGGASTLENRLV